MQYSYNMLLYVKNIFLSLRWFKNVYKIFLCKCNENILVLHTKLKEL